MSATPSAELLHEQREAGGARRGAAVSVRGVSKAFKLPHQRYSTLKERALHLFTRIGYDRLQALDNVSVEIEQGEFFGIVGRNGSGKSTLLKCLAGIYQVDSGELEVQGRLAPFIELGVGFNPELTARDNVVLNATLMGVSPSEARARFDDVIAFAELGEFVDLKLKHYSSGMQVRLAFSVATQVDADILLVDEVLAVGDSSFQDKCFDTFERLKAEGRTIVLVTHDMSAIERFADRALLIDRGRAIAFGDPKHVAEEYIRVNLEHTGSLVDLSGEERRIDIGDARLVDPEGVRLARMAQGERGVFEADFTFRGPVLNPVFVFILVNEVGEPAFVTDSLSQLRELSGRFEAGDSATFRVDFENRLAPGRYAVTTWVSDPADNVILARRDHVTTLRVEAEGKFVAFDLPHDVELRREE